MCQLNGKLKLSVALIQGVPYVADGWYGKVHILYTNDMWHY